jgi:hypothetical protein
MPDFIIYLILFFAGVIVGAILALLSVLVGGWLVSKGKTPNEGFIRRPKGEVFTVETGDTEEFPGPGEINEEKHVLEKTKKFLKILKGE